MFHNCCLVFAPKAKVGGSQGRALWRAVDTGCYLWGAEIVAIFSSVLGPCTVVVMISPQLSSPPPLLRDEEELAPWHGEEAPGVFVPGGSIAEPVPSMTDISGRRVPLSHQVWALFLIRLEDLLQGPLGQDVVGSAPLGSLQEGRQSFSVHPVGQPSFPHHSPSRPPLPAGLSRSLGILPGPATSAGALLEAGVDGASSPPCRELAGYCNSLASQQLAAGQSRRGREAGPGVLSNMSTLQQSVRPRLKGECCKPVERLM